jgi:hypothetical protein
VGDGVTLLLPRSDVFSSLHAKAVLEAGGRTSGLLLVICLVVFILLVVESWSRSMTGSVSRLPCMEELVS